MKNEISNKINNFIRFRHVFKGFSIIKWYYYIHYCDTDKQSRIVSFGLRHKKGRLYARSNSSDMWLISEIIVGRKTENGWIGDYDCVLKELERMKDRDDIVVLDAGANIGLFSRLILDTFPNARIIAVEADKNNYDILVRNLEQYGNRVNCIQKGIWYRSCNLKIMDPDADDWGKRVEETSDISENTIAAVTIEDIIEKNDLGSIDVVKMDIEGSEYYVFKQGAMKWLDGCEVFVVETHDSFIEGTGDLVNSEMKKRGYNKKVFGENQVFER